MSDLQATMAELRKQVEEKRELQYQMRSLRERRSTLFAEVSRLDKIRLKEQADVTRLEKTGVVSLLHRVTGKLEEKREQERQEAEAAAAAHDAALREMQEIDGQIDHILDRLDDLRDAEYRYSKAEQAHKEVLKAAGGALAKEIEELERSLAVTTARQADNQRILGQIEMCLMSTGQLLTDLGFFAAPSGAEVAAMVLPGKLFEMELREERQEALTDAVARLKERFVHLREMIPQTHLEEGLPQDILWGNSPAGAVDLKQELEALETLVTALRAEGVVNAVKRDGQVERIDGKLLVLKNYYSTRQEELNSSYRTLNRRLNELLQKGV